MRRLALALLLLPLPACAQIRERIYPAPTAPLAAPPGATLITVTTADGLTLRGLQRPGRADRPVLLLLDGTADDVVPAQLGNELHNAAVRAKRVGASFVMDGEDHVSDGAKVAAIVDAAAARLARPDAPLTPPAGVHVFPFAP